MDKWQEVIELHLESRILTELALGQLNEVILHLENASIKLEKALESTRQVSDVVSH